MVTRHLLAAWIALVALPMLARADDPSLTDHVLPLLKTRCVKCHGPAKQEGKLDLSTAGAIALGGEDGTVISPRQPLASLLWQKVDSDEMPPEDPLTADEKQLLKRWIAAGASGLPDKPSGDATGHRSFAHLSAASPPAVRDALRVRTTVDRFLLARLETAGLAFNPEALRRTLIRRVSFDLTGLPPSPEEIAAFDADTAPDAYERMVERYLASPHYGERWGKYWLDAAGYADSNGYFNADTDRPLAYRYRDYVVRAINDDKPLDRFVVEQLAGDELSGFEPDKPSTPEAISLLVATHFLRNAQDGTGESDGNADEVRIDRYSALEGTMQIVASSLLGLTMQCAKCHDHKFEPITQRDYYQFQSVFYPVFNVQDWLKPNERFVHANLPGEVERWEASARAIDTQIAEQKAAMATFAKANRLPSVVLFHDEFDVTGPALAERWSNTAPGDDIAAGEPSVALDSDSAPGALRRDGSLVILESGAAGDRWLATKESFDWSPNEKGHWIQVTFDLLDDKAAAGGTAAARIAYLIGLCDYNDNGPLAHGNLLIDGNPAGGAAVHLDYPGSDSTIAGDLGTQKYQSGHNYGVRITNTGKGKVRIEHLVDWMIDGKPLVVDADSLTDGGFGFEYCCGRSFVVDNVLVERSADSGPDDDAKKTAEAIAARQKEFAAAIKSLEGQRGDRPGKIACALDRSATPPDVFLLERGNYGGPRERIEPAPLGTLAEPGTRIDVQPAAANPKSTGRRLAWARWLTAPGSRSAALLARVQVNRAWQYHFGRGIVATTENLGTSGAAASHPELLDYLAGELVSSGWSMKALHRLILGSAAYRQTSALLPTAHAADPENRLLWRFPLIRLDAEAIRDAMLSVAGALDRTEGGPYVPTTRDESGEVVVDPAHHGALRRALYLQQRRTQTLSMLGVFDAPSIVFNCLARTTSTMPLQSLCQLNSPFAVEQASRFADRIEREAPGDPAARVARAFLLATARDPSSDETRWALEFVKTQSDEYATGADGQRSAWRDFCQMLLASNAFLYVD